MDASNCWPFRAAPRGDGSVEEGIQAYQMPDASWESVSLYNCRLDTMQGELENPSVNAVLAAPGIPVFVPKDAPTTADRRLTSIADVSCDPGSPYNPIPIYDRSTTFDDPIVEVDSDGAPLAIMAIDHLPSLLPMESSEDFSTQLLPSLMTLDRPDQGVWGRAKADFDAAMARL